MEDHASSRPFVHQSPIGGTIRGTFSLLRKPIEPAILAERASVLIGAMPGME